MTKFIPLIVLVTLPHLAFAQTAPRSEASCFTCQFPFSSESAKKGQASVCDDLFSASCLLPNGKSKFEGKKIELAKQRVRLIAEARDNTAKAMGYKNFDEGLKKRLQEAGVVIKEPIDPKAWKTLKQETDIGEVSPSQNLYLLKEQCENSWKETGVDKYWTADMPELESMKKKMDVFQERHEKAMISLYAQDIPSFLQSEIKSKCDSLKKPEVAKLDGNNKALKTCGDYPRLKKEAIDLFRIEGTPEYKEKAQRFVRTNTLPAIVSSEEVLKPDAQPVDIFRKKMTVQRDTLTFACNKQLGAMDKVASKVFEEFALEVSKSKPTIDTLIDTYYSENQRKSAERMLKEVKSDVQSIVGQFVKNADKKTDIVDGYDDMKLFWLEKLDNSAYLPQKNDVLVLDDSQGEHAYFDKLGTTVRGIFNDASLSHFKDLNADYMPNVSVGNHKIAERVNMMPAFIKASEKNPYSFFSVLAHEAGHKIGPKVSAMNGYDLKPEYKDLLGCYKDKKSINLQKDQEDETIADYISSEVLARHISRLPRDKRQQALTSAMEDVCIFEDEISSLSCKDRHPEYSLRVGGIYGANPNLRKALGCEGESPRFKTCGLTSVTVSNEQSVNPEKSVEGVQ